MTESNGATVAPRAPVPLSGPIADLDSAYRYAVALAQADILPQDLRGKPSNVLTVLLYGQYLGIPPVIATQVISVVKGRPQLAGKFLLAKVREAGHTPVVEHGKDKEWCKVTITRGDTGEVHSETFSVSDAAAAGLCTVTSEGKVRARSKTGEPLPWENYTARMLMWRALGFCVDVICPEIKMGFGVEGEEYVAEPERPALAHVAAQRADRDDKPAPSDTPGGEAEPDDAAIAAEVASIETDHTLSDEEQMAADHAATEAELTTRDATAGAQP